MENRETWFAQDIFIKSYSLQKETLLEFYSIANEITKKDFPFRKNFEYPLVPEKNFFSILFLAVINSIKLNEEYMPLYAMVNQCMRAWVTACDNILDNEYKEIFPFAFNENGERICSILTIMIADRVLCNYISKKYKNDTSILEKVNITTLNALSAPALQEGSEEKKPLPVLPPEEIIDKVHLKKTGELFTATLSLPFLLEPVLAEKKEASFNALKSFGIACQIIDDIHDFSMDVKNSGHNYILSLEAKKNNWNQAWIEKMRNIKDDVSINANQYPDSLLHAQKVSLDFFQNAFDNLNCLGIKLSKSQRNRVVALMYKMLKVDIGDEFGHMISGYDDYA